MNYFYKYVSLLIDNSHRYFTNKKHAAVTLEDDYFDNRKYSPEEFYNYTKQFFDNPGLFFSEGDRPDFSEVKKLYSIEKNFYTLFAYPSPFKTKWEENNTACFDLFTKDTPSDTILLFAPGWARPNLVAEASFSKMLLK